jgi:hypothetical protein
MKPECSLPSSQESATGRTLDYMNQFHYLTVSLFKLCFNIILSSTPKSPKWSSLQIFRLKFCVRCRHSIAYYIPLPSRSPRGDPTNTNARSVSKVRGLTLLIRVGTLWRCGDGLLRSTSRGKRCTSYNAPTTSRKRTADRWSLLNFLPLSSLFMVRKAQKSLGARSEWNSVFGLEKVDL